MVGRRAHSHQCAGVVQVFCGYSSCQQVFAVFTHTIQQIWITYGMAIYRYLSRTSHFLAADLYTGGSGILISHAILSCQLSFSSLAEKRRRMRPSVALSLYPST